MNILNNFKVFFLFSYFCCQTSSVSPGYGSGPNFTGSGFGLVFWIQELSHQYVTSDTKSMKTEKKVFNIFIISFNRFIPLGLRYRALDPNLAKNRIWLKKYIICRVDLDSRFSKGGGVGSGCRSDDKSKESSSALLLCV